MQVQEQRINIVPFLVAVYASILIVLSLLNLTVDEYIKAYIF